ncbi:hypothetical protein B0H11DRAFT_2034570 [Mycena galericulata]|nr:hypothetical protein B0H11DRAFT_2034570 [Mycena galericulata]
MSDTYFLRAVYFPLHGNAVTRFILPCSETSPISSGIKQALLESGLPYTPPLACFKLEDFPRDPIPSLGQRLSDDLANILERRIEPEDRVVNVWPTGIDKTLSVKLDLVIMPEQVVTTRAAIAALPTDLRVRYAGAIARQNLTTTVGTLPSPSACSSDPKKLFEHAGTLAGRPFGRCGPPSSLFDSHLAGLADDLRDLTQAVPVPSSSKVAWALKFFKVALAFHGSEKVMEKLMQPLLDELFEEGKWQDSIQGGRPEAHGPGWIYQLKTQKGLGGDPEAQSIADWEKLLSDKKTMYGKNGDRSRLPTILISHAGPQLDIAVVVYVQHVLVDHLFSISLRDGINVDEQVLTLARLATCLANTCAYLSRHYNDLREATASVSPLITSALHLPVPASATPPHSLLSDSLGLKFLYKLSRITGEPLNPNSETDQGANTRYAVFVALGGGIGGIPQEEVVVKFAKHYNTEGHTKLAALGLAPKLYYYGAVRGGLLMIVMEKVVGMTAFRWLSLNNATYLPLSVYTDVETAIKALHSVDLVFGDLRLPNIMMQVGERDGNGNGGKGQGHSDADTGPRSSRGSADTSSRGTAAESSSNNARERDDKPADSDIGGTNFRALLIDFDWAAQDGVGRYPATISMSEEWAPGVDPHGLMHKAHDLYRLDLLRQTCN